MRHRGIEIVCLTQLRLSLSFRDVSGCIPLKSLLGLVLFDTSISDGEANLKSLLKTLISNITVGEQMSLHSEPGLPEHDVTLHLAALTQGRTRPRLQDRGACVSAIPEKVEGKLEPSSSVAGRVQTVSKGAPTAEGRMSCLRLLRHRRETNLNVSSGVPS